MILDANGRESKRFGLKWYYHWLHGQFPAGEVEALPEVSEDGATAIEGVRVAGDLKGSPLLKLAANDGALAMRVFAAKSARVTEEDAFDVLIAGAGVAGVAAALEAKELGLRFLLVDASRPLATLHDLPAEKPIHFYPENVTNLSQLRLGGGTKESLLATLEPQLAGLEVEHARVTKLEAGSGRLRLHRLTLSGPEGERVVRARSVLIALGRSGNARHLHVPGEAQSHVFHRFITGAASAAKDVVVVGGGDAAIETALALDAAGARVHLVHRGEALVRPKPALLASLKASKVTLKLGARVESITAREVVLRGEERLSAEQVFVLIGREAPTALLKSLGLTLRGERTPRVMKLTLATLLLATLVYLWKAEGAVTEFFRAHHLFPFGMDDLFRQFVPAAAQSDSLAHALAHALGTPTFYYSFAYSLAVVAFGIRRVRRRPTPLVKRQTLSLVLFQIIPLFLLPQILLPWLGAMGFFDHGWLREVADALFPAGSIENGIPIERAYWRAYGFVLAWPLFIWNVFTDQPNAAWLVISLVQTFVIIPLIVWRFGKGGYCGWICSCGALAETMGDGLRERMPHGAKWNRLNMLGQGVLAVAMLLLVLRVLSWTLPSWLAHPIRQVQSTLLYGNSFGIGFDYVHVVDLLLAGILGVGLYVGFSGRMWCRFACPLAALMNIYARFSRFRIFAEKSLCISCGNCTANCHQGIDVMAFAREGKPMNDPQCVGCSACVQVCPTGTLTFGHLSKDGPSLSALPASLVQMREGRKHLRVTR
jgi:thioredoxin reductase/ferredoxin